MTSQKIVTKEELEVYLNQGWRITAVLPSRKIVVEST